MVTDTAVPDINLLRGAVRKSDIRQVLGAVRKSPEPDLIGQFSGWYEPYHQVSAERAQQRLRLMRALETAIDVPIGEISAQDVEWFLAGRGVSAATTLKDLKMLRPFFKWLWQHGHITGEQAMRLNQVRAPRGANKDKPRPYSRREIAEFWEYFDEAFPWTSERAAHHQTAARGEFWTRRYIAGISDWGRVYRYARRLQAEAIIAVILFGGLRRVEAFGLRLEDMHYENAYLRVMGARKNEEHESYERAVPMVETMRVALANWLEFRAQVIEPEHDRPWLCLWKERFRDPMSFTRFGHLLEKVGDGYEMHRMRHTFATERLRAGMPIETLKEVLGHASINQTLKYADISADDVIRVAEKTNNKFAAAVQRQHEIMG